MLNMTPGDSPLLDTLVGTAALLKTTTWKPENTLWHGLPEPISFNGQSYAAVQVIYKPNTMNLSCHQLNSSIFMISSDIALVQYDRWNDYTSCFAVAKVTFEAGLVGCRDDFRNGSRCALSNSSSLAVISHQVRHVEADPLVEQVFNLMQEVMAMRVTTGRFTLTHTDSVDGLNLGLETFLKNVLVLSYQGTWSALTGGSIRSPFIDNVETDVTTVILLDASPIIRHDDTGLCTASIVTTKDGKSVGLVQLTPLEDDDNCNSRSTHDVLRATSI